MNSEEPTPAQWQLLAERIAGWTGLAFAPERRHEFRQAIAAAAADLGASGVAECVHRLLACAPSQVELGSLARHLTVGETYFFRDRDLMAALSERVLPQLIQERRDQGRFLRLWSAGCCTGEEPYTLAILLQRLLPDRRRWDLRIAATDINPQFVAKAEAGVYGEWSFRGVPAELRERYFEPAGPDRHAILPTLKTMVQFSCANLMDADDRFRVPGGDGAVDLVVCRNVLMYFSRAAIAVAVARFHRALAPGGWLVVSPSEVSSEFFPGFSLVQEAEALLYRKDPQPLAPVAQAPAAPFALPATAATPHPEPQASPAPVRTAPGDTAPGNTARALANQGRLAEALVFCERWIASDRLDAAAHYMRAVVLLECKDSEGAREALRRSIYLDGRFVMAHVALGNLARGADLPAEGRRHFGNARELLAKYAAHDPVAEADGLTAGQLAELLAAMAGSEEFQ